MGASLLNFAASWGSPAGWGTGLPSASRHCLGAAPLRPADRTARQTRRAAPRPPRLRARAVTPFSPGAVLANHAMTSSTSSTMGSAVSGAPGTAAEGSGGSGANAAVRRRVAAPRRSCGGGRTACGRGGGGAPICTMQCSARNRVCSASAAARSAGLSSASTAALPSAPPALPDPPVPPASSSVRSSAASNATCYAGQLACWHLRWREPVGVPPWRRSEPQGRRPRLSERRLSPPRLQLSVRLRRGLLQRPADQVHCAAACMTACSNAAVFTPDGSYKASQSGRGARGAVAQGCTGRAYGGSSTPGTYGYVAQTYGTSQTFR
eukprot:354562-Chlamydomonas_euryale.AAC.3